MTPLGPLLVDGLALTLRPLWHSCLLPAVLLVVPGGAGGTGDVSLRET